MRPTTLTVQQWINVLRRGGTAIPFSDRSRISTAIGQIGEKPSTKAVKVLVQPETVAIIEGR